MERKRILTACVAVFLFSVLFAFGFGVDALAEQHGKPQKFCPVFGGEIDKLVYADYQGKRVYFCCASCIDSFKKSPQKYVQKMEAQGIRLDSAPQEKKGSMQRGKNKEDQHVGLRHEDHMHEMGGKH